jgi:hypothetical protein
LWSTAGRAPLLGGLERLDRIGPARLAQGDESQVEGSTGVGGAQLGDPAEFPQGLVEHSRLVEGDAEVAVLRHPGIRDAGFDLGDGGAGPLHEPGRDEAIQRLAHLELDQPRFLDDLLHVVGAVEQIEQALLGRGQLGVRALDPEPVHLEDQVEGGNLLLDLAPLVHPPGALEQERFGVDGDEEVLLLRPHPGLEVEGARRPGEEVVDGLLDLDPHVFLEIVPGDDAHAEEDLPQLLVAAFALEADRLLQLLGSQAAVLHQQVAKAVATIDDAGVADPALVEVDVAEVLAVGDRHAAGPLAQREQLEHVREAGFLQAALDRHFSAAPRSSGRPNRASPRPPSRDS